MISRKSRLAFRGYRIPDPQIPLIEGLKPIKTGPLQYGGGIDSSTAICVSWRFSAACFFPISSGTKKQQSEETQKPDKTWIYILNIPLPQGDEDKIVSSATSRSSIAVNEGKQQSFVNTHTRQVLDILRSGKSTQPSENPLYEMLFAQEAAVSQVEAKDVLCYVQCSRYWNEGDWTQGGSYELTGPIVWQSPELLSQSITLEVKKSVEIFLNKEIALTAQQKKPLPAISSGYSQNLTKNLKKEEEKPSITEEEYQALATELRAKSREYGLSSADIARIPPDCLNRFLRDLSVSTTQTASEVVQSAPQEYESPYEKREEEKPSITEEEYQALATELRAKSREYGLSAEDRARIPPVFLMRFLSELLVATTQTVSDSDYEDDQDPVPYEEEALEYNFSGEDYNYSDQIQNEQSDEEEQDEEDEREERELEFKKRGGPRK